MAKKPLIVLTHPIIGPALEKLPKRGRLKIWAKQQPPSPAELKTFVRGAKVIISMLTDRIDEATILAAGPELKIVANYAVGFDNLDLVALQKHNVVATNTPGVLTESVSEHAMALILACVRRIVEADQFVRRDRYHSWQPTLLLGHHLYGQTLGIVGLGRIGQYLAQMAFSGFHMNVLYHDVVRNEEFEELFEAKFASLDHLLKQSDVVSLHVPLLPSTYHLIGKREFRLMKKTAYIINTSRGPVIDEKALIQAVRDGQIAGAGLDVFENEGNIPAALRKLSNVVLTPHIASATFAARAEMTKMVVTNVLASLAGRRPPDVIDLKETVK